MTIESYYTLKNYPKNEEQLIKKLRIPPNWTDIKITKSDTDKYKLLEQIQKIDNNIYIILYGFYLQMILNI